MKGFIGVIVVLIIIYALFRENINNFFNKSKIKKVNEEKHNDIVIPKEKEEDKRIEVTSIEDLIPKKVEQIIETKEYVKPNISLLTKCKNVVASNEDVNKKKDIINDTFNAFNVKASISNVYIGSLASVYEVELGNTKIEKVESIKDELILNLGNKGIRILKPIPGKNTLGIEVPNENKGIVYLKNMLNNVPKEYKDSKVLIPLGMDTCGEYHYFDLNECQNLLVTGGHSTGKSSFLNSIIITNLLRSTPEELKFILVDGRKNELEQYDNLPNNFSTYFGNDNVDYYLVKILDEIERRIKEFNECGFSNIIEYNSKYNFNKMCYLLVIIDAYQDFFKSENNKHIINEIIHLGNESGVYLIVSSNNTYSKFEHELQELDFSSISLFQTKNDFKYNRVKDDDILLGNGDAFHKIFGSNLIIRTQVPYVSFDDIKNVTQFIRSNNSYKYKDSFKEEVVTDVFNTEEDPLYKEILLYTISMKKISSSLIQRKFRLGYNRTARIIDKLEENGIVSPVKSNGYRDVLVKMKEDDDK